MNRDVNELTLADSSGPFTLAYSILDQARKGADRLWLGPRILTGHDRMYRRGKDALYAECPVYMVSCQTDKGAGVP